MDKNKFKKAQNITLDILEFILCIPTATVDGFINQKDFYNKYEPSGLTYDIRKWISSLKQKGYIEVSNQPKKDTAGKSIRLTNKAKLKLLDKISAKIKPDKKLRFISFDIPEEIKYKRDRFRKSIKRLGFVQIQKSLWVIDKNVSEFVELAAKENKVDEYVAYIISEKSDIDRMIKKKLMQMKKSNSPKYAQN